MGTKSSLDEYIVEGQLSIYDFIGGNSREWSPVEEYAKRGSGFRNGKLRIQNYFMENKDFAKRIEFVKKEYGIGGFSSMSEKPNTVLSGDCNGKGHEIVFNNDVSERIQLFVTHGALTKVIDKLIKQGEYI